MTSRLGKKKQTHKKLAKRKKTRCLIYTHFTPDPGEWTGAPARTPPSSDSDCEEVSHAVNCFAPIGSTNGSKRNAHLFESSTSSVTDDPSRGGRESMKHHHQSTRQSVSSFRRSCGSHGSTSTSNHHNVGPSSSHIHSHPTPSSSSSSSATTRPRYSRTPTHNSSALVGSSHARKSHSKIPGTFQRSRYPGAPPATSYAGQTFRGMGSHIGSGGAGGSSSSSSSSSLSLHSSGMGSSSYASSTLARSHPSNNHGNGPPLSVKKSLGKELSTIASQLQSRVPVSLRSRKSGSKPGQRLVLGANALKNANYTRNVNHNHSKHHHHSSVHMADHHHHSHHHHHHSSHAGSSSAGSSASGGHAFARALGRGSKSSRTMAMKQRCNSKEMRQSAVNSSVSAAATLLSMSASAAYNAPITATAAAPVPRSPMSKVLRGSATAPAPLLGSDINKQTNNSNSGIISGNVSSNHNNNNGVNERNISQLSSKSRTSSEISTSKSKLNHQRSSKPLRHFRRPLTPPEVISSFSHHSGTAMFNCGPPPGLSDVPYKAYRKEQALLSSTAGETVMMASRGSSSSSAEVPGKLLLSEDSSISGRSSSGSAGDIYYRADLKPPSTQILSVSAAAATAAASAAEITPNRTGRIERMNLRSKRNDGLNSSSRLSTNKKQPRLGGLSPSYRSCESESPYFEDTSDTSSTMTMTTMSNSTNKKKKKNNRPDHRHSRHHSCSSSSSFSSMSKSERDRSKPVHFQSPVPRARLKNNDSSTQDSGCSQRLSLATPPSTHPSGYPVTTPWGGASAARSNSSGGGGGSSLSMSPSLSSMNSEVSLALTAVSGSTTDSRPTMPLSFQSARSGGSVTTHHQTHAPSHSTAAIGGSSSSSLTSQQQQRTNLADWGTDGFCDEFLCHTLEPRSDAQSRDSEIQSTTVERPCSPLRKEEDAFGDLRCSSPERSSTGAAGHRTVSDRSPFSDGFVDAVSLEEEEDEEEDDDLDMDVDVGLDEHDLFDHHFQAHDLGKPAQLKCSNQMRNVLNSHPHHQIVDEDEEEPFIIPSPSSGLLSGDDDDDDDDEQDLIPETVVSISEDPISTSSTVSLNDWFGSDSANVNTDKNQRIPLSKHKSETDKRMDFFLAGETEHPPKSSSLCGLTKPSLPLSFSAIWNRSQNDESAIEQQNLSHNMRGWLDCDHHSGIGAAELMNQFLSSLPPTTPFPSLSEFPDSPLRSLFDGKFRSTPEYCGSLQSCHFSNNNSTLKNRTDSLIDASLQSLLGLESVPNENVHHTIMNVGNMTDDPSCSSVAMSMMTDVSCHTADLDSEFATVVSLVSGNGRTMKPLTTVVSGSELIMNDVSRNEERNDTRMVSEEEFIDPFVSSELFDQMNDDKKQEETPPLSQEKYASSESKYLMSSFSDSSQEKKEVEDQDGRGDDEEEEAEEEQDDGDDDDEEEEDVHLLINRVPYSLSSLSWIISEQEQKQWDSFTGTGNPFCVSDLPMVDESFLISDPWITIEEEKEEEEEECDEQKTLEDMGYELEYYNNSDIDDREEEMTLGSLRNHTHNNSSERKKSTKNQSNNKIRDTDEIPKKKINIEHSNNNYYDYSATMNPATKKKNGMKKERRRSKVKKHKGRRLNNSSSSLSSSSMMMIRRRKKTSFWDNIYMNDNVRNAMDLISDHLKSSVNIDIDHHYHRPMYQPFLSLYPGISPAILPGQTAALNHHNSHQHHQNQNHLQHCHHHHHQHQHQQHQDQHQHHSKHTSASLTTSTASLFTNPAHHQPFSKPREFDDNPHLRQRFAQFNTAFHHPSGGGSGTHTTPVPATASATTAASPTTSTLAAAAAAAAAAANPFNPALNPAAMQFFMNAAAAAAVAKSTSKSSSNKGPSTVTAAAGASPLPVIPEITAVAAAATAAAAAAASNPGGAGGVSGGGTGVSSMIHHHPLTHPISQFDATRFAAQFSNLVMAASHCHLSKGPSAQAGGVGGGGGGGVSGPPTTAATLASPSSHGTGKSLYATRANHHTQGATAQTFQYFHPASAAAAAAAAVAASATAQAHGSRASLTNPFHFQQHHHHQHPQQQKKQSISNNNTTMKIPN